MSQTAAVQSPNPADDAKMIIDDLVAKARAAMETFESADQETVDEAVTALAWSIYKPERARTGRDRGPRHGSRQRRKQGHQEYA